MVSLVAKIEYVTINSNWTQDIMIGQKKKLRYSEQTPWFPQYYIGWIGIGNCDQETSSIYQRAYVTGSLLSLVCLAVIVFSLIGWLISFLKFQNSKFREFAGGSSEQNQEDTYMYLVSEMLYVVHFLFIWWKIVDIFKLHQ